MPKPPFSLLRQTRSQASRQLEPWHFSSPVHKKARRWASRISQTVFGMRMEDIYVGISPTLVVGGELNQLKSGGSHSPLGLAFGV